MLIPELRKSLRLALTLFISVDSVVSFQQCSDVELTKVQFVADFQSKGFPFRLYPPTDYLAHFRYVLLVDMTNSMISGPCPFDVGNAPTFHTNFPYNEYDPNKPILNDKDDGRGADRDCVVDPDLPIVPGSQWYPNPYDFKEKYRTHLGSDYRGYRLDLVERWIRFLKRSLTDASKDRTQIMIIPVSGGRNQLEIEKRKPSWA